MMMHDWTGAKEAYDEIVINDGKKYYGLTNLYRDNFKHTSENNIESVFEIQFGDDNTVSSGIGGRGNDNAIVNFGLARGQYFGPSGLTPACGWGDIEARHWEVVTELSSGAIPSIVIECLNRVRQRTEVNMKPIQESIYKDCVNSKANFLERLQTERVLELSFETDHWFDLKRWALWNTPQGLQALIARDQDFENFVPSKTERLSIPQSDIDNNPNLTQNPNY